MTDEQMRDLVKECGLDWQRGYMPLFDDDPTNRYAVLIDAVEAAILRKLAEQYPVAWLFTHNRGNGGVAYTFHMPAEYQLAYRDTCVAETPLYAAHQYPRSE